MNSNLACQSRIAEEEIIQPQPVNPNGTNPAGYPDGEVSLRYKVLSFPQIELDPPDQGLEICKGMLAGFCILAASAALVLVGIFAISSIAHHRHAAAPQTHQLADLKSSR